MALEIPDNLDLLTNIKAGLEYRIRILKDQIRILIRKNHLANFEKKQFHDILIKDLNDEIKMILAFQGDLIEFLKEKYDIEPELKNLEGI